MHTSSAAGEKDALDVNVYVDGEHPVAARRGQRPDRGVRQRDQRAAPGAGTSGSSTTPSTPCPPAATPSRRRTSSALVGDRGLLGRRHRRQHRHRVAQGGRSARSTGPRAASGQTRGSRTVNVVPCQVGGVDRRSARRARRRSRRRSTAPGRCPGSRGPARSRTRKKRWNSSSCSSTGMPMPVSLTARQASPSWVAERGSSTRPPSSVNLMALLSRLSQHPLELDRGRRAPDRPAPADGRRSIARSRPREQRARPRPRPVDQDRGQVDRRRASSAGRSESRPLSVSRSLHSEISRWPLRAMLSQQRQLLRVGRSTSEPSCEHLGVADDAGHRRAQLVADRRDELVLRLRPAGAAARPRVRSLSSAAISISWLCRCSVTSRPTHR